MSSASSLIKPADSRNGWFSFLWKLLLLPIHLGYSSFILEAGRSYGLWKGQGFMEPSFEDFLFHMEWLHQDAITSFEALPQRALDWIPFLG